MKTEIEVKILKVDKLELISRILNRSGNKTFEGKIITKLFDYPDLRFKTQRKLLRIRLLGNERTELTFKDNPRIESGTKIFDEKEVSMDPNYFDNICDILKSIGFIETLRIEKFRTEFYIDSLQCKVEIDEYPDLDCLAEIEGESAVIIDKAITELGLSDNERSTETFIELYERLLPGKL